MKAIIIGGSGATGQTLVHQLLNHEAFEKVTVLVRRSSFDAHPKLHEILTDFTDLDSLIPQAEADVAFSCLGTTLKSAGSQKEQWKIDHDLNLKFAQLCCENHIMNYILVSAVGANSSSKIFYNRMKGSLEKAIKRLCFSRLIILQPAGLIRPNSDRKGEIWANRILSFFNRFGLFQNYRPIPTETLAKSMIVAARDLPFGVHTLNLKTIIALSKEV